MDAEKLLAYVQAAKKAAAVAGHQGLNTDKFHMGEAFAYQNIENLLMRKLALTQPVDVGSSPA